MIITKVQIKNNEKPIVMNADDLENKNSYWVFNVGKSNFCSIPIDIVEKIETMNKYGTFIIHPYYYKEVVENG